VNEWQEWFERVWEYREETLYPQLFGTRNTEGIYVLTFELFEQRFKTNQIDPRWLNHGVLRYEPSTSSPTWKYVSSGLSNAWEDDRPQPTQPSGYGIEFALETASEESWALQVVLNLVAYQLLLGVGRFGEARVIGDFHRIPLNAPIDGESSSVTHLLVVPARENWQELPLESGTFSILHLVGITADEAQFAREQGSDKLISALKEQTLFPATDAHRASVVQQPPPNSL
jgi:suppressor of fused protein SUFU